MTYKIGDKLKLLTSLYEDEQYSENVSKGSVLDVVQVCRTEGQWIDQTSVQLDFLCPPYNHDNEFEIVEEEKVKNRFAVGDKVISGKDASQSPEGTLGYVSVNDNTVMGGLYPYRVECGDKETAKVFSFKEDELELLSVGQTTIHDIARPVLEERKIGKVRMDLFNEGFPNAVLEIAKVMTWANQNKGYEDHDWKNLPNASKDIPAAASRHGIKQLIQKSKGVPAIDRVDEESKIVHLAHQAFNILAELELVLTGVIK